MIKIFGRDLFSDPDLAQHFAELTGMAPEKPFECVGTIGEVNAAVQVVILKRKGGKLPVLLEGYRDTRIQDTRMQDAGSLDELLRSFDPQHYIPQQFIPVLKEALDG